MDAEQNTSRWLKNRRHLRRLVVGTSLSVMVMLALLVFESEQRADLRNAARLRSDSITAITFHFEREFLRLQRSLDLAVNGRRPYDPEDLNLHYELMLSRIGILRDSTNIEALISLPQYASALPKVERIMATLGHALEKSPPQLQDLEAPLREFDAIGVELHELTLAANSEVSRQLTLKEDEEIRQNTLILVLSVAMLLFLLASGIALIRRQRRQEFERVEQNRLMDSLRELNEHLETKVQERTRDILASMQAAQTSALRAEHALALVEATLEATDNAILVVNAEGHIASTNQHFSALLHSLQGATVDSVASVSFGESAHAELDVYGQSLCGPLALPDGPDMVLRDTLTLQDGRIYSRVSHPHRVQGAVVGRVWSLLDITEQVLAESRVRALSMALSEELARSLQHSGQLNALLGAIPDMVWMKDMQGRFMSCNPAFERLIGAPVASILGKTEYDFNPADMADRFVRADRQALDSAQAILQEHWQNLPGTDTLALLEVTKVAVRDSEGQLIGVLGLARDVTKLRTLMQDLEQAKEAALHASEAKSMFLANMSHEIRTPMNAVIGMTSLALDTELSPRQHNYLSKIKSSSESLLSIINDILDFSKIEAGMLQIERASFVLEDVFDMLSGLMALKAERQGIELAYTVATGIPPVLLGDSLRLGQILSNLVSNALKFTAGGNVVVNADILGMEAREVHLQFSVSDQGIGLTAEQTQLMFQPFAQADASTTRRYGGTGLGLAICKNLVELLGGSIWVESQPGVGSTFFFTVRFGHDADRRQSEAQELARALQIHAGKSIVVVDDNAIARHTLQTLLEPLQLPVLSFADGAAVVECMRGPQPPDVALYLVDWFMPEPDGIETIRQLRAIYTDADATPVPMLLVTAHIYDDDLQQVDHLIDGLVAKPISARRLHSEIAGALGLRSHVQLKSGARKTDGLDWSGLRWLDILLVEDVEVNREVMLELLGGVGLKLRIASNGAEAIAAIQAQTPDLVLMDCQMPVMDGYTATAKLRAMPEYAQLPIVALTAGAMIDDKRRCFAAGMNGYVSKPVRLEHLYEQMILCMPEKRAAALTAQTPHAGARVERQLPAWPGIDVALGLAQVGGRQAMFLRVLKKFRDNQCVHFESQFAAAMQAQDWAGAARLAHSLKGVGRTLGASELAERIQMLEIALEQRNVKEVGITLEKVHSHLHTVTTGLGDLETLITGD